MIRIENNIADCNALFESGEEMTQFQFISRALNQFDEDTSEWLVTIPMPSAIEYIAEKLNVKYKFV